MAESDDLDQILDSALDDFRKLDLATGKKVSKEEEQKPETNARLNSVSSPSSSSSVAVQGLGMGMGLPGPKQGKNGKKGKQSATTKGSSHASEALEKLTKHTQETFLGMQTALMDNAGGQREGDNLDSDRMVEEFVKQFGGLSGPNPDSDLMVEQFLKQLGGLSGPQDMESIVQNMMQQLLSKETLQEPMKEIGERYPRWLEEHKADLAPEDYDRHSRQHQLMLKLNEVYEEEPNNFPKIVDLLQKMQECGQPPNEIANQLAPDLDLAGLSGQLSPEMLQSPECCIM